MGAVINAIFGNWQTSALGLIAAVIQAHAGGMTWHAILAALPTLLIGVLAKDSRTGSKAL